MQSLLARFTPSLYALLRIVAGLLFAQHGVLLGYPTAPVALALATWAVCTRMRVHYEEQALIEAFPEYESYRQRVRALVPTLPRRVSA